MQYAKMKRLAAYKFGVLHAGGQHTAEGTSALPSGAGAWKAEAAFTVLLVYLLLSPLIKWFGLPVSLAAVSLMDWQRMFELLTVALVIVLLAPGLLLGRGGALHLTAPQLGAVIAFFGLGALSCSRAVHPGFAWLEWSWTLCWFAATALLATEARQISMRLHDAVSRWSICLIASYATLFYAINATALFSWQAALPFAYPGFDNVRPLSDYQTMVVPFLPFAISRVVVPRWRWAAWILAGAYMAIVIATGSRSILLGQSVALFAIGVLEGRRALRFLGAQLVLWLAGLAFYLAFFWLWPQIGAPAITAAASVPLAGFARFDSSLRGDLWQLAWTMVKENPLLGIGPMHFAVRFNPVAASPHNHLVQLAAEWGIPALLAFILLVGSLLRQFMRAVKKVDLERTPEERAFSLALATGLLALLVQSCVSPVFNNPLSQMGLSLLVVLAVASAPLPASGANSAPQSRVGALVAITALLFFAWQVMPWLPRIEERNFCYVVTPPKQRPTVHLAPRFWQQGWLFPPCERNDLR